MRMCSVGRWAHANRRNVKPAEPEPLTLCSRAMMRRPNPLSPRPKTSLHHVQERDAAKAAYGEGAAEATAAEPRPTTFEPDEELAVAQGKVSCV